MQNTNYTALSSTENATEAILPTQQNERRKKVVSFLVTGSLVLLSITLIIMIGVNRYHSMKNGKVPFAFKNLSLNTKFIQFDHGKILNLSLECDLINTSKKEKQVDSIDLNLEYKKLGHQKIHHHPGSHIGAFKLKPSQSRRMTFYIDRGLNNTDQWEENCKKSGKSDMRMSVVLRSPRLEFTVIVPFVLDCHELFQTHD